MATFTRDAGTSFHKVTPIDVTRVMWRSLHWLFKEAFAQTGQFARAPLSKRRLGSGMAPFRYRNTSKREQASDSRKLRNPQP